MGVVPSYGRIDVSDKIAEARFFAEQLNSELDLDRARWFTSAALAACQAAIDYLAWNVRHVVDDPDTGFRADPDAEAAILKF